MAEYIEREATIELLRSIGSRDYRREKGSIQEAIKMVSFSEYTPAADVVEVVRCRECVHWKPTGSKAGNSFLDMEYIGGCESCIYSNRRRPQKCSCCRRNRYLKDCYEED